MYEIVLGRNEDDLKKYGTSGTLYLGKHLVQMDKVQSLANKVLLDAARPHVILVTGKRGSGKSWTLGVIAEELANMPSSIKRNIAGLIIDTMGIYWSMKFPNKKEESLLRDWNLEPQAMSVNVFIPKNSVNQYKKRGIPFDNVFTLSPQDLSFLDWAMTFNIDLNSNIGILLEKIVANLQEKREPYSIDEMIDEIKNDTEAKDVEKKALINYLKAADSWGLFEKEGTKLKDFLKAGETTVLDVSTYEFMTGWSVRALVIGILAKKIFNARLLARKVQEMKEMGEYIDIKPPEISVQEIPLIWTLIDEAHEFIPEEGSTPASFPLIQWAREGREPGLTLVMATQQPGKLKADMLSQADLIISHTLTSRIDMEALNNIMQTYLPRKVQTYIDDLPKIKGAGIVLDDNSEKLYSLRVRPRLSWHAGGSPSALQESV